MKRKQILCCLGALLLLGSAGGWAAEVTKPAPARKPAAPSLAGSIVDGPALTLSPQRAMGDAKAPLIVVEFSEYECAACKQYHLQELPEIKRVYVDRKIVRYYHKNLSVDAAHAHSVQAGALAYCAGRQGNFWPMQQRLFEESERLSQSLYVELAEQLKLKSNALEDCRWDAATTKAIATDRNEAAEYQINVVPSFIVARNTPNGIVVESVIKGEATFQAVAGAIEEIRQR